MFSKTAPETSSAARASPPLSGSPTWSLATRLTAWYGLSAFVLIALASTFLYWTLVSNLDREDDEFLADKIQVLQELLRERPQDQRLLREEVEWEPAVRQYGLVYVRILDAAARTIVETP